MLHRPHRTLAALGIVAVIGLLALASAAQEARKYYLVDTVTVSQVDPSQHVLAVKDAEGNASRFVVDDKTAIEEGGKTLTLAEVEPGDRVAINAREPVPEVEGHPLIADEIIVVVDPDDQ